jgi:hypothetical protein
MLHSSLHYPGLLQYSQLQSQCQGTQSGHTSRLKKILIRLNCGCTENWHSSLYWDQWDHTTNSMGPSASWEANGCSCGHLVPHCLWKFTVCLNAHKRLHIILSWTRLIQSTASHHISLRFIYCSPLVYAWIFQVFTSLPVSLLKLFCLLLCAIYTYLIPLDWISLIIPT